MIEITGNPQVGDKPAIAIEYIPLSLPWNLRYLYTLRRTRKRLHLVYVRFILWVRHARNIA